MAEQLIPTPDVRSLNPIIGKIYAEDLFTVNHNEKTKIKKKWPGMTHLEKDWPETLEES